MKPVKHSIPIFQIDAFTNGAFTGNPAAVCPMDTWLPDDVLQSIAEENNLSETAFVVVEGEHYRLRWFTPTSEVDLCGHATLATAYVLFRIMQEVQQTVSFITRSGVLTVQDDDNTLTMRFPSQPPTKSLAEAHGDIDWGRYFNHTPKEVLADKNWFLVFENQTQVAALKPNLMALRELPLNAVVATAEGDDCDFISRFFAPKFGIDEDPVTGSAHCSLTPYWAEKLGKNALSAMQISNRQGWLRCEQEGDSVLLSGDCNHFLTGSIHIR